MPSARVLLLGDAIRVSYHDRVAQIVLPDGLTVVGPAASTGNSRACREGAEAWVAEYQPDVACFSCGPHAAEDSHALDGQGRSGGSVAEPVSLPEYEEDLLRITEALRRRCGRQTVFVTMTPVLPERFAASHPGPGGSDLARSLNRSIAQYNELAIVLMGQLNVMVTRLCHEIGPRADECFGPDGVLLTPEGVERAAQAVANGVYAVL